MKTSRIIFNLWIIEKKTNQGEEKCMRIGGWLI